MSACEIQSLCRAILVPLEDLVLAAFGQANELVRVEQSQKS